MEDQAIVALYFQRAEKAIAETVKKYGGLCRSIAQNLLPVRQDAEECVNDTWHAAWQRIPPERPTALGAFLGRITRNLAISRFRKNTARRRSDGLTLMLSELEDCVPAGETTEEAFDRKLLGEHISKWLESLPAQDRALFLGRYWYGESLRELSERSGISTSPLAQKMYKLRLSLKAALEAEGVVL